MIFKLSYFYYFKKRALTCTTILKAFILIKNCKLQNLLLSKILSCYIVFYFLLLFSFCTFWIIFIFSTSALFNVSLKIFYFLYIFICLSLDVSLKYVLIFPKKKNHFNMCLVVMFCVLFYDFS